MATKILANQVYVIEWANLERKRLLPQFVVIIIVLAIAQWFSIESLVLPVVVLMVQLAVQIALEDLN